jgi:SulP family sulfate permease
VQQTGKRLSFLQWRDQVTRVSLREDAKAGLTGALITIPQVIAYALIAGMPAEYGLYTAITVTVFAALLGSSWHLVTGPAAAISMVVLSLARDITPTGTESYLTTVFTLTLMMGFIQCGFGLLRLGALLNFISHTVVVGFTSGASVLIALSQVPKVLGIDKSGDQTYGQYLVFVIEHVQSIDGVSVAIAGVTILVSIIFKRWGKPIPHLIAGLAIGSGLAYLLTIFTDQPVEFLGDLPSGFLQLTIDQINPDLMGQLLPGAFALALLGLIEAVSIARSLSVKSHQLIDGNQEFIAQGLANAGGSLLSGFASSGSFTRSAANYDAGAKTPMAQVFMALMLVLTLLLFPSVTRYLSNASVAGSLIFIAYNLFNINELKRTFNTNFHERVILIATSLSAIFLELTFAIYIGVFLSLAFYLQRTSRPSIMTVAPISHLPKRPIRNAVRYQVPECPQIKMIRIDGSLFFGSLDHIQQHLRALYSALPAPPKVIIIGKGINFIDASGAQMLEEEIQRYQRKGGRLIVTSLKGTVLDELAELKSFRVPLSDWFCETPEAAIEALVPETAPLLCATCDKRIFNECQTRPKPSNTHLY